jgi:enterochelin esterase-like enzyme
MKNNSLTLLGYLIPWLIVSISCAQWEPTPNDTLTSYRILPDNRIRFSIYAPEAQIVMLGGSDIPDTGNGVKMKRTSDGVWNCTVGPVVPGAYRYNFNIDGVFVLDPKNTATSESNMNVWSLIYIEESYSTDSILVPHGTVSEVTYYSTALNRFRRMHIYTPYGYEINDGRYPVFYLLHGALDCDDAWHTVGRAGFILDKLIACQKAVSMIVVMPAGHTGPFRWGQPLPATGEFAADFIHDIRPYIEDHYRVLTGRKDRAIAGLSMGGAQAINLAIDDLQSYGYIGVFSSGIFGITGQAPGANAGELSWEEQHQAVLDDAGARMGLRLFWFATGKDDFLLETSRVTVEMLRRHGFDIVYRESSGGHTWINWRNYLYQFAPLLFR